MASPPTENTLRITLTNFEQGREDVSAFQARVAQQSELISLLKQRADDTLVQLEECEKRNESLMSSQEQLVSKLHLEVECRQSLEERLSQLTIKHSQTSFHVKSCEDECEVLQRIVEELRVEKEIRDELIKENQMSMEALNAQIENYKRTVNTLKDALQEMKSQFGKNEKQKIQLQDKVVELGKKNLTQENLLTTRKLEIDHWKSEHTSLLQTCLSKETQLREAHKKIAELELRLSQKSDKILSLASRFRLDSDSLSKDQAISRLKWELKDTREELHALKQEFEIYKAESKRQLESERELNMKLRHLQ